MFNFFIKKKGGILNQRSAAQKGEFMVSFLELFLKFIHSFYIGNFAIKSLSFRKQYQLSIEKKLRILTFKNPFTVICGPKTCAMVEYGASNIFGIFSSTGQFLLLERNRVAGLQMDSRYRK